MESIEAFLAVIACFRTDLVASRRRTRWKIRLVKEYGPARVRLGPMGNCAHRVSFGKRHFRSWMFDAGQKARVKWYLSPPPGRFLLFPEIPPFCAGARVFLKGDRVRLIGAFCSRCSAGCFVSASRACFLPLHRVRLIAWLRGEIVQVHSVP